MILTTTGHETEQRIRTEAVSSVVGRSLDESILRVLIYYDLFGYPLTLREVYLFADASDILPEEIEEGLESLRNDGTIDSRDGYWYLASSGPDVVARRKRMEIAGERMWKIARRIGSLMKMAPFVRGIYISGQLSRYIADEQSDIDYFIVTDPGRLWIVRTFFVLLRRTLFLNSRKYFCTNYYVTADNLAIRERNIYAACETTALKPLWNRDLFRRIVAKNRWVFEFYPNFSFNDVEYRRGVNERRSRLQRLLEGLIPKRLATRLDRRLMETTRTYWHRKFPHCTEKHYETSLRCTPNESRAHPDDQSIAVLAMYRKALTKYGLSTDALLETRNGSHRGI